MYRRLITLGMRDLLVCLGHGTPHLSSPQQIPTSPRPISAVKRPGLPHNVRISIGPVRITWRRGAGRRRWDDRCFQSLARLRAALLKPERPGMCLWSQIRIGERIVMGKALPFRPQRSHAAGGQLRGRGVEAPRATDNQDKPERKPSLFHSHKPFCPIMLGTCHRPVLLGKPAEASEFLRTRTDQSEIT